MRYYKNVLYYCYGEQILDELEKKTNTKDSYNNFHSNDQEMWRALKSKRELLLKYTE